MVEAQRDHGLPPFTLTIADEAHRTTGVLNRKRAKVDFQLVHTDELQTDKRLYMTATPRIYTAKSKGALAKRDIKVVDMSDEDQYGPQFHRLRFKTAVEDRKLSDYRVIVLAVNESRVTPGLRDRLDGLADEKWKKNRPTLTDMTRLLGVSLAINGLSQGSELERPGRLPRTMAYANSILRSKWFTRALMDPLVKGATTKRLHGDERAWDVTAEHLDASASALRRNEELVKLRDADKDGKLRVLSNVKLFTEGVDVPSLNAVAFLDPRDSQVDVVQAVGRVMRRAPEKRFGYIIVPIVVEPGKDVADALKNGSEGYHTVGKVLRALQSHDERLAENTAQFVQVLQAKSASTNGEQVPGSPRDRTNDDQAELFDQLDLEAAGDGIYAHVAAASGLGSQGQIIADEITHAVRQAAAIFTTEEVEGAVGDVLDLPAETVAEKKTVATVAALLLCNACLMHRRLRDIPEMKMLPGLGRVGATDDPISVLLVAWNTILDLDYKPVFEPALAALKALPNNMAIQAALRGLSECADNLADSLNDLGYDHAGPLYHRILGSAKSDGAYYTNNVSALMLARLAMDRDFVDWSDEEAVKQLRIIDPACGTGTLLMAALRTIKARMRESGSLGEGNDESLHKALVEDVLCGLDINRHGVQLAACNLTLGAPSVNYRQMNLVTMQHGPQGDGTVRAGSLEILSQREDGPQPTLFSMASKLGGTDTLGARWEADETGADFPLDDVDLVIMNPPYTANDKRGQKFKGHAKEQMDAHELRLRDRLLARNHEAGKVIDANSIGTFFTPLADQMLRSERGVLATVLPVTAFTNASGLDERRFRARRFQIERIISSHDPKRGFFSENTKIHECLLIARRRNGESAAPTEFIALRRMPTTPEEAIEAADAIRAGSEAWGSRTFWPAERMEAGDWTPCQWYDADLARAAGQIQQSPNLDPVGHHYDIGPAGQRCREAFQECEPDAHGAVRLCWSIDSELRRSMKATPESWRTARPDKKRLADKYWGQRSHLLVAQRYSTTSSRLTAIWTPEASVGSLWTPVAVFDQQRAQALAAWWNSTPTLLTLLNHRTKKLTYPSWSLKQLRGIPIPKPDNPAWDALAAAYTTTCDMEMRPPRDAERCPVRCVIDRAAAIALDVDEAEIAEWRRRLALEPTISNQTAEREGTGMSSGGVYVDSEGVVRGPGGQRIEGIELLEEPPAGGGRVAYNLTYPVSTDEDGKVEGVDMTVAENRRQHHNKLAGITKNDEEELKNRLANQPEHRAFVFRGRKKEGGGKRWEYEAKVGEPLDPTQTHDTPQFPLGSVLFVRGDEDDD